MNKIRCSRIFVGLAITAFLLPFLLELVFGLRIHNLFRSVGIRYLGAEYWFFTSAMFFIMAAALQFPFKEEEGWHCGCGYDLSFLNKRSTNCPECGEKVQLEWSSAQGTYSRKTLKRLYWTIFLFAGSLVVFCFGILGKLAASWANY